MFLKSNTGSKNTKQYRVFMEKRSLSLALLMSVSGLYAMGPDSASNTGNYGDCIDSVISVGEAEEGEKQQEEQEDTEWAIRLKRFRTDMRAIAESNNPTMVGTFEDNASQRLFDAVMKDGDRLGIPRTAALDAMLIQTILNFPWNYPGSGEYGLYIAMADLLISNGANPRIIVPDTAIVEGAQDIAAQNNEEDGNGNPNKRCKYMTEKLISCPIS